MSDDNKPPVTGGIPHMGMGGTDLSRLGGRTLELEKAAALAAKEEIERFNDEVYALVLAIETVLVEKDLTWGHWHSAVEAFNKRNEVVMPEMKMKAIKELFEKITLNKDAA